MFRGADLRYNLELSLEEVARGTEAKDPHPDASKPARPATAAAPSPARWPKPCTTCGGRGEVRVSQGFFSIQQTCPTCHGQRQDGDRSVRACGGEGRTRKHKTLSVKIPAGVDHEDRIRLAGEGEAGVNGGPPGDLYVVVQLKAARGLPARGRRPALRDAGRLRHAALGGEIEIPTLDGQAKIRIPAETQTGQVFRLPQQGHPAGARSVTGDLYCHVAVETPVNLTAPRRNCCASSSDPTRRTPESHTPRRRALRPRARISSAPDERRRVMQRPKGRSTRSSLAPAPPA